VVISGRRPVPCQDVAFAGWRERAARSVRMEEDTARSGTAPVSQRGRGAVWGERAYMEVDYRLGDRRPNARPPGVCRIDVHQDAVDRGREEQDKAKGLLGKVRVSIGEASGAMASTGEMVYATRHANGHLGCNREREV
jgi:hypothetical protein